MRYIDFYHYLFLSILFVTPARLWCSFFSFRVTAPRFYLHPNKRMTLDWCTTTFRSPLAERSRVHALNARTHVRCACAEETPKRVNTDNYAFHASAHTSKFHLIPLTAKPASFFIPPRARTALLSCSPMGDRSLHVHLKMKKNREVLIIYCASPFFNARTYTHKYVFLTWWTTWLIY